MNTRWLALLVLLPCSVLAAPEINVGALYDYLDGGKSTLLKRVRNGGDTTAFVKVSVAGLVYGHDGTPREIDQESLPMADRGLVASLARLIVPVLPDAQDSFNLSDEQPARLKVANQHIQRGRYGGF